MVTTHNPLISPIALLPIVVSPILIRIFLSYTAVTHLSSLIHAISYKFSSDIRERNLSMFLLPFRSALAKATGFWFWPRRKLT